uniref:Calpain catalytic domain-containing protein n=1 Tax=Macrostomum lignano TaxID=282301 RepID=A0A1I8HCJ4_9PLAT
GSGPESHQVSIVSRGRDAHGAGAAHVRVAQLVDGRLVPWNSEQSSSAVSSDESTHEDQPQRHREVHMLDDLKVRATYTQCERVCVQYLLRSQWNGQNRDAAAEGAHEPPTKVEVELCRMRDGLIHSGTSWDVAAAANFVFGVGAEQAGVVPLLHHHEGDTGLVVQLQAGARLAEGAQLNCSSSSLVMPHSSAIRSSLWAWTRTVAAYRLGWASMLATTAAMDGLERSPAGGWVTSPPMKMTGSRKTPGRTAGTRMELMPPSLTFIFRQRLLSVCGEVFTTFLACTHWVARPNRMSPTRFTSAYTWGMGEGWPHGRLAGQHHHDELQALEGVLQVAEHRLHLVLAVGVLAEAGLAGDGHAGILADPLQLLGELPQRVLAHNALSGKAGDGPHLDLDAGEELLAAHVPDPLLRQRLRAAAPAVLNARRRQHPAAHLRHARNQHEKCTRESHLNAEGLQMAVVVEVGLPHQVVNLALPVRCGPGRGLDHGGRLRIRQLLDAALAADNVADFQRQVGVLVLLAHLQARQHRIAQPHLIPLGEVLHNSAVESLAVLHLQREALGAGRPPGDVAHSRVVGGVQLRLLEEGPAHGGVLHAGQVAHDHVQRVHRLSRDAAATAFESLLQGEQGHLAQVAQADAKHAVLAALARQRHLQLQAVAAQRERVPAEILPAVEDRSLVEEEALVVHGVHHGVDDLPVDPARTLVRHNRHVIVMQEALGQPDLEVVGTQADVAALLAAVRPHRRLEDDGGWRRLAGTSISAAAAATAAAPTEAVRAAARGSSGIGGDAAAAGAAAGVAGWRRRVWSSTRYVLEMDNLDASSSSNGLPELGSEDLEKRRADESTRGRPRPAEKPLWCGRPIPSAGCGHTTLPSSTGKEALFADDGYSRFDLNQSLGSPAAVRIELTPQGELGDCWVVAALASLADHEEALQRVVPPGQTMDPRQGYCGVFRFRFFRFGRWVEVLVDDRLPTRQGELVYIHSASQREFWSALVEKAYAKLFGCYESLSGGLIGDALDDFTGGMSESFNLNRVKPESLRGVPRYLFQAFDRNSLVGAGILDNKGPGTVTLTGRILPNGLVAGHAYTINDIRQLRLTDQSNRNILTTLVRVRNPWGDKVEWNGPWSDRSPEWSQLGSGARQALGLVARDDGEFWMRWEDFVANFDTLDMCHAPPEAGGDSAKRWAVQAMTGVWKPGQTAGGRPAYRDTHWMNPQFHVRLVDSDDDDDNLATCIIGLQQRDNRGVRRQSDYLQIGFVVYHLPTPQLVGRQLPRDFFNRNAFVAACDYFINSRANVKRFNLQPGNYVIVPCTFDAHQHGEFLLRVYTEREAAAPAVPLTPASGGGGGGEPLSPMTPKERRRGGSAESSALEALKRLAYDEARFRQVFAQQSGSDMALDPWELQQHLPQMLASIGRLELSIDACKQLVGVTDVDSSGKLSFAQFNYLWSLLIMSLRRRYEDRNGRLDLSGFLRAMAAVVSAFRLFQNASRGQAYAKMTMEEICHRIHN